jgi:DNA replication protein DnaC
MTAANPVVRKGPKVDLDTTQERLTKLGLLHASEHVGETLAEAVKESWPPHRFLDQLLEAELTVREERRLKTSLRLSGLPTGQTLGNFDFGFQPSVERNRIETLATCAWIRAKENLLTSGPSRTASRWPSTGSRTCWRRPSAMPRWARNGCAGAST